MSAEFRAGVLAQPENLAAGAEATRAALSACDLAPLRTGTVVFSGIGASWHALLPAVRRLRAAGHRAFALPAPDLAGTRGLADAYVLVSQSGRSVEVLEALDAVNGRPVYAVSANGDGPLAQAATTWLPLGPRPDTAVSTLSYTATLQTLGLLVEATLDEHGRGGWQDLPEHVQTAIEDHEQAAARLAARVALTHALDAVGAAGSEGSAGETALLGREALHLPATGMETRQYLHGPLEAVREGYAGVVFGGARELALAASLASYGAVVGAITTLRDAPAGVELFRLPALAPLAAPILEIVPVQLLVAHVAELRGLPVRELARQQDDTKVAAGR